MTNNLGKKLAVIALGNKNSGKSHTWYNLFGQKVVTGKYIRPLYFNSSEYTNVYLLNGSMEERRKNIKDELIPCDILLCSVQYSPKGKQTIEYLHQQGFQILVYWLNPGCYDKDKYTDARIGIIEMIETYPNSIVRQTEAIPDDNHTKIRADEICEFIFDWAKKENLLLKIPATVQPPTK